MTWVVDLTRRAEQGFRRAPTRDRRMLGRALDEMRIDPFKGDVQPVRGVDDEWRRRVGRWRIFFAVERPGRRVVISDIVRRTSTTY